MRVIRAVRRKPSLKDVPFNRLIRERFSDLPEIDDEIDAKRVSSLVTAPVPDPRGHAVKLTGHAELDDAPRRRKLPKPRPFKPLVNDALRDKVLEAVHREIRTKALLRECILVPDAVDRFGRTPAGIEARKAILDRCADVILERALEASDIFRGYGTIRRADVDRILAGDYSRTSLIKALLLAETLGVRTSLEVE